MKGSQLESADWAIKCLFLPPSTTSRLQPIDQGIIAIMKKYYRHNMLHAALGEDNAGKRVQNIMKAFTVKDAFFMIAESWDCIKPSTVTERWYDGVHVGSCDCEEDTSPDQRLTTPKTAKSGIGRLCTG
ncbi:hypothetical protein chiPu_0017744 [Chiloscyllium punctatum]|uniref:DDE-1 domain-containing protein n=1 Tax=Chiloscyllium punctatum TaxID=137246 RepID=A0A401RIH4_CHIPU|nr:hypothetical protein [Chiloscyllium punctatum]